MSRPLMQPRLRALEVSSELHASNVRGYSREQFFGQQLLCVTKRLFAYSSVVPAKR